MPNTGMPLTGRGLERYVLCVDDDFDFLKSIEFFLPEQIVRSFGDSPSYRFIFQGDPAAALDTLRELIADGETVAMLISDQQMPDMKGIEFLAAARELSPESVRVLLTGYAGIEAAVAAINEQLLDKYLTKPIDNEHDFVHSVKHLLERFELRIRLRDQGALIRGLYGFANDMNAAVDLESTKRRVVDFTRSALCCEHVHVILDARAGAATRGPAPSGAPGDAPGSGSLVGLRSEPGVAARVDDCPWLDFIASGVTPLPAGPVAYGVLASGDEFIGLILASSPAAGSSFGAGSVNALGYIADSASIAIQNQLSRGRLEEIAIARAKQLEDARGRLEILDRLKSDFLSFVSHELRTPLNYLSAIEMLGEGMDRDQYARMVHIAHAGYERLEGFVMNALEYFELLAAPPALSDEFADLADIVRTTAEAARVHAPAPAEIDVAPIDAPCFVPLPERLAEKIVRILLDNALKFAGGTPRVSVTLEPRPGWVTLTVADQGLGFPSEWATEIFRPFTVADSMHHGKGTALNLAKAAAIVEASGGRIRAHSAGTGQGATFIVELPLHVGERLGILEFRARSDARRGPPSVLDRGGEDVTRKAA